jgi:outer membrane protein assembly factor BamB
MCKNVLISLTLAALLLAAVFLGCFSNGIYSLVGGFESSKLEANENDWPMFHQNLMNTGRSSTTAPKTNQTLWTFNTGGPVDAPIVSDGVVYFGSLDDKVYALNASSGAVLWSYTTGANVLSPVAVAEGMVFVGSEDFNVYALNKTTGVYVWSFKTGYFVDSAIAYSEGLVNAAS